MKAVAIAELRRVVGKTDYHPDKDTVRALLNHIEEQDQKLRLIHNVTVEEALDVVHQERMKDPSTYNVWERVDRALYRLIRSDGDVVTY